MEITELTVKEIVEKIKKKEIGVKETVLAYLKNIEDKDNNIKAFLSINNEEALIKAEELDKENEKNGQIFGIPVAIKDNINVYGTETTAGSKILKGYISPYDATVVKKIKEQNGITIGKTNCDEFAMGSSTENSAFFNTKNPVNTDYVPGGSSGGSAASVAANEAAAAFGSDTGGSIREPAGFCGIVGLKPTYGRVSRYGLIAFGSSLDVIGPLAKNVEDAAILTNVIAGFDHKDETTANLPVENYTDFLKRGIKGKKLGVIKEINDFKIQDEVSITLKEAINKLEIQGCEIEEVSIPHLKYALPTYYLVAPSEASSNLSRFDGVRYGLEGSGNNLRDFYEDTRTKGFGREVKRRILIGTFALSEGYFDEYYLKASKVRRLIAMDFEKAFEKVDALILPTTATTAFKFNEKKNPLEMYMSDIFTIPMNLAGIPAISIPFGKDNKGLPIGIQIVGKWFEEGEIFQISYALEQSKES
jgi:aspartyl-tRNA(Asn)/glutamyl-tRNA(Gln) amidotransferase subunit A